MRASTSRGQGIERMATTRGCILVSTTCARHIVHTGCIMQLLGNTLGSRELCSPKSQVKCKPSKTSTSPRKPSISSYQASSSIWCMLGRDSPQRSRLGLEPHPQHRAAHGILLFDTSHDICRTQPLSRPPPDGKLQPACLVSRRVCSHLDALIQVLRSVSIFRKAIAAA